MKKTLLLAAAILLGFQTLQAQVIYSEDFATGTAGVLSGQIGWSNSSSTNYPGSGACAGAVCVNTQVVGTGLTSPVASYFNSVKSMSFDVNQDAVGHFLRNHGNTLPDAVAGTTYVAGDKVYVAFLVNFTSAINSTTLGQFVRVNESTFSVGMRLYVQKNAANAVRFGVEKSGASATTFSNYNYALNTTYLVVMKYEYIAGATNDLVSLYINPTGAEASNTPVASTAAGDDKNLDAIVLYTNQANNPTGKMGAVKATRTWTDLGFGGTVVQTGTSYRATDTVTVRLNHDRCNFNIPTGGTSITSITNLCPATSGTKVAFTIGAVPCVNVRAVTVGKDSACLKICNNNGICDTVNFVVTTLGNIATQEIRNDILSIKPTLATDFITLSLSQALFSEAVVSIVDLNGRILSTSKMAKGADTQTLDVHQLAKGMYLVYVRTEAWSAVQKVVIVR
jgi:hypothetical protein